MRRTHLRMCALVAAAACSVEPGPPDASVTVEIVRATASTLAASSRAGQVFVRPGVGFSEPLLSEMAYELAVESQFVDEFPELPSDLFARGRSANQDALRIDALAGPGVRLLDEGIDQMLTSSPGEAYERLRNDSGRGAVVLSFAQPAVVGDEALVYYLVDDLLPMGRATFYAYLRRVDSVWTVVWKVPDYVE